VKRRVLLHSFRTRLFDVCLGRKRHLSNKDIVSIEAVRRSKEFWSILIMQELSPSYFPAFHGSISPTDSVYLHEDTLDLEVVLHAL
jgi:hypothetical protein